MSGLSDAISRRWRDSASSVGTTTAKIGACAVAVDVDLPDQRAGAERRLQFRDGDELPLRQLQHEVATVEIDQLIGPTSAMMSPVR